jgi:hypothetical protein
MWADEHDAQRMLAEILKRSGELRLAARHLILAGIADAAHDLGREADQYLDVTGYLDQAAYWVRASALRLIAAQADLVPDDQVAAIAERAFTVLDQVQAGELRDTCGCRKPCHPRHLGILVDQVADPVPGEEPCRVPELSQ